MAEVSNVPGWATIVEWFGYSPNFHDAEVLAIDLRRHPEASIVRVHAWRTNSDTTEAGYFRQDRHALVTFTIRGITAVKLEGWNHQNVLSSLWAGEEGDGYVLELPTIYGVDGEIAAADISVSIEPFPQRSSPSA